MNLLVIRASVPRLDLDSTFEQKNDIAKAVEDELAKVMIAFDKRSHVCSMTIFV